MRLLTPLLALAIAGLSAPAPTLAQTPASADTPGQTSLGVRYTQPRDWTARTDGPTTTIEAPERDLAIAVVDVGPAKGAATAAAKAWALYRPDRSPTVRLTTPGAPGEGWDERVAVAYESSPGDRAVTAALALRQGTAWTVMIADGSEATFGKRSAAAAIIQQSLRPAGFERESFAGVTAHQLTPRRVQALRDFVTEAARTLEVPGVGLALVDRSGVVWQGGIGVRKMGKADPVDEDTRFMVASNTKGMSTLLLSVLVDEGKLDWNDRVVDLYPAFRLGSDATTQATLVRHLVCACTGLPRKDYAFILGDTKAPAIDTFRQLGETQPTSGFGELFQYNNLMASAAGYLGGGLSHPDMEIGAAYDLAMAERIFRPLDMSRTTFDYALAMQGNWARPHGLSVDGKQTEIPNDFNFTVYPYRPAGGAWSTAADMARYAQLELTRGLTPQGTRIVSEKNLLERRARGVPVAEDSWYGMGLFNQVVSGVPVVTHGGTLLGYHSNFWVLPEAGVGAVILTNADTGAAMLEPFLRRLLEVLYDGEQEAARDIAVAADGIHTQALARREQLTVPGDPVVLANLATSYRDPEVGTINISDRNGTKWVEAGFIEGPLATRTNPDGSVSIVSAAPGAIGLDALVGSSPDGRTLTVHDSQHEYVYTEER